MTDLPVTAFRSHRNPHLAAGPHAPGLHSALIAEWAQLCATPAASIPLRTWARDEEVLIGCTNIGAVLDRIDAAPIAVSDALLNALLRLYQSGQQLAGRVLLQAMLPKLMKMSERGTAVTDVEERRHSLIASFWTVLAKRRPEGSKIAAGLALDALHHTTVLKPSVEERPVDPYHFCVGLHEHRYGQATDTVTDPADLADLGDEGPDPDDARDVLAWGVRVGAISGDDADLLAHVYLGGSPAHSRSRLNHYGAASARGLAPAAVRKRCSRASQALAAAVRITIDEGGCGHDLVAAAC